MEKRGAIESFPKCGRVTLAKAGKFASCGSGQYLHHLPRVGSINLLVNMWMQLIRAGGWKKCLMKPLLHGLIGMERCYIFLIVLPSLGLQMSHQEIEGKVRATGLAVSILGLNFPAL